jgi:hypothetical protein
MSASPKRLTTIGCILLLLGAVLGIIGLVVLAIAIPQSGFRGYSTASSSTSAATEPSAGTYVCTMKVGDQETAIRKFSIEGDTYNDLSFQQGGGHFKFDVADGTLLFDEGPFKDHFTGVFVQAGGKPLSSSRYSWNGDYESNAKDAIHLLDNNTGYSKSPVLGVQCDHE